MDVLDWQRPPKENGTVHSALLPWRGEAVGTNKEAISFVEEKSFNILYRTLKKEAAVHLQAAT